MNFWRCFTHWIGGMGVLVFLLAIIPLSGGSNINLMRAESPGPSVGKLVPKMRHTARLLYIIYFGLTTMEIIFLLFGKMPLYDAICTSLAQPVQELRYQNDKFCSYNCLSAMGCYHIYDTFRCQFQRLLPAFSSVTSVTHLRLRRSDTISAS